MQLVQIRIVALVVDDSLQQALAARARRAVVVVDGGGAIGMVRHLLRLHHSRGGPFLIVGRRRRRGRALDAVQQSAAVRLGFVTPVFASPKIEVPWVHELAHFCLAVAACQPSTRIRLSASIAQKLHSIMALRIEMQCITVARPE